MVVDGGRHTRNVDRRTGRRLATNIRVDYLANHFMGNGTMVNVSRDGMEVRGNYEVTIGLHMSLRIVLPEQPEPLYAGRAIVKWVRGLEFGVQFLSPTSQVLNRFIGLLFSDPA